MRRKSRRTGRRLPHGCSPRLEALEIRALPGDTLLGVAVVACQAFASPAWTPLPAAVPEGADPAKPADASLDWGWMALPAGRAGPKRSSQEQSGPARIREGAPQAVALPIAEGPQPAIAG